MKALKFAQKTQTRSPRPGAILWVLLAACLAFPLGNLIRVPLGNNVALSPLDICVGIVWIAAHPYLFSTVKKHSREPLFRWGALFVFAGAFALTLNSLWLGLTQTLIALLYLVRLLAYMSLIWIIPMFNTYERTALQRGIMWAGIGTVLIGLAQYFFFPDLRPLFEFGWDEHLYRLFGTLLDPNYTGAVFVIALGLFLTHLQPRPIKITLSTLTLIAIFLTYSRSAYLMLAVSAFTYALLKRSMQWIFLSALVMILGLTLIPKNLRSEGVDLFRTASIIQRKQEYTQALTVIQKYPLGVGFNAYRYVQKELGFVPRSPAIEDHSGAGVPNSYLFVLATTGIVGLTAYAGFILTMMRRLITAHRYSMVSVLMGLLVHALFENSLFYPSVMFLWFVTFGLQQARSKADT